MFFRCTGGARATRSRAFEDGLVVAEEHRMVWSHLGIVSLTVENSSGDRVLQNCNWFVNCPKNDDELIRQDTGPTLLA